MTENKNEDQQPTRSDVVREAVSSLLTDTYQGLYRSFDDMEERLGITPGEVAEALQEMGEEEIREHYAQWADIDIREDDADTDPTAVPDPHDASSYNHLTPAIRIEGGTAYVRTAAEAMQVCDHPGIESVVIEDNTERIKMQRMMRGLTHR